MRLTPLFAALLTLAAVVAAGPPSRPPTGVYRTAGQFHRQAPAVPGTDVRVSPKRGGFVVMTERGPKTTRTVVPFDSAWGYVDEDGRAYRYYRHVEYRVEQADTLTIYSNITVPGSNDQIAGGGANVPGQLYYAPRHYYFSRGLTGIPFPLTAKNLRLAFGAGNPAFLEAVEKSKTGLSEYDLQANTFYLVGLYRRSIGR